MFSIKLISFYRPNQFNFFKEYPKDAPSPPPVAAITKLITYSNQDAGNVKSNAMRSVIRLPSVEVIIIAYTSHTNPQATKPDRKSLLEIFPH
ncbi:MAG: hypothetical protein IPO83_02770 [Chitinophagaceae bacterium]|nr:hypothetical protein [Chitinophagaceae bacterium]